MLRTGECGEKAAQKEDKSGEEYHQSGSESDEGLSNDTAEKEVIEAEQHGDLEEPLEARVELGIKVDSPTGKIEEASVDESTVEPPEVEEAVVKNDIHEEIAEKNAVVEDKIQGEHLADKTVATIVAAGESPVEAMTADALPADEREERIVEFAEIADSKPAVYEDRGHSEGEYNGDIDGDGESESGDNEDKNVYVSGSGDVRETNHERVYVLGGTSEDVRREDDRVYVLGSSEGLKVRKDEDVEDSVAQAYAELRVAGKGPAINLDEWQFTDSDEDYDAVDDDADHFEEDEDIDEEEEGSGGSDVQPKVEQKQPRVTVAYQSNPDPIGSKKAWVLPSKAFI